jgi:hypothetical protein
MKRVIAVAAVLLCLAGCAKHKSPVAVSSPDGAGDYRVTRLDAYNSSGVLDIYCTITYDGLNNISRRDIYDITDTLIAYRVYSALNTRADYYYAGGIFEERLDQVFSGGRLVNQYEFSDAAGTMLNSSVSFTLSGGDYDKEHYYDSAGNTPLAYSQYIYSGGRLDRVESRAMSGGALSNYMAFDYSVPGIITLYNYDSSGVLQPGKAVFTVDNQPSNLRLDDFLAMLGYYL